MPSHPCCALNTLVCDAFDNHRWIFRYVLKFFRDGILPRDAALLTQVSSLVVRKVWQDDCCTLASFQNARMFASSLSTTFCSIPSKDVAKPLSHAFSSLYITMLASFTRMKWQ